MRRRSWCHVLHAALFAVSACNFLSWSDDGGDAAGPHHQSAVRSGGVAVELVPSAACAASDVEERSESLIREQDVGGVHIGMRGDVVIERVGSGLRREEAQYAEADGAYHQTWTWPGLGLSIDMMADSASPSPRAWEVGTIHVRAPSRLRTRAGVGIGSTVADLELVYGSCKSPDAGTDQLLVGNVYEGLLFELRDDRVVAFHVGAFAE